jgi:hypothetical protein
MQAQQVDKTSAVHYNVVQQSLEKKVFAKGTYASDIGH